MSNSPSALSIKMVLTYMKEQMLHMNAHSLGRSESQYESTHTDQGEGSLRHPLLTLVQTPIKEAKPTNDDVSEVWKIWG